MLAAVAAVAAVATVATVALQSPGPPAEFPPLNGPFIGIVVLAFGFFFANASRLVAYMRLGGPADRTDHPWIRLRNLLAIGIGQRTILRDPVAGAMHAAVFWGFLVLTAGTIEILIQGIAPGFSFAFLPAPLYALYLTSQTVFAVAVLGAVAWLVYRRLVIRPARLQGNPHGQRDALVILALIGALMVTLLLMKGSGWIGDPAVAGTVRRASWWVHVLLILAFLNYLPYSKHLHIITSLPNVYLSNTSGPGPRGAMRPMDLEAEGAEQFGAADVNHLAWKNLLDGYSCTECGRCTAACPASLTGKPLSPRKIVMDVRERLMELAPALLEGPTAPGDVASHQLLDHYITEDELWACTSCRACVQECPVSIDQLDVINELRRHLVLMESRFPAEIQPVFQSLERNGSPWTFSPTDRAAWAAGLDLPTMAECAAAGRRVDVLFWVGCMGSFDDRAKRIAVAVARILRAAGVEFAILGQEERCNGDPARRLGNEYLYQTLARGMIATLDGYGVTTVLTLCPHCFHQMGTEYPQLGGHYEVVHHSTFIAQLLADGRLPLVEGAEGAQTIVYHDSCYLGRYHGVYDAPREALRRALPVVTVADPPRARDKGLCCGAGGGRMWMEERTGVRINAERTTELLATGADAIAAACPFCMTMLSDGVAAAGASVPVYDIAEVVASRLAQPVVATA